MDYNTKDVQRDLYFMACTMIPIYGSNKVKQWLEVSMELLNVYYPPYIFSYFDEVQQDLERGLGGQFKTLEELEKDRAQQQSYVTAADHLNRYGLGNGVINRAKSNWWDGAPTEDQAAQQAKIKAYNELNENLRSTVQKLQTDYDARTAQEQVMTPAERRARYAAEKEKRGAVKYATRDEMRAGMTPRQLHGAERQWAKEDAKNLQEQIQSKRATATPAQVVSGDPHGLHQLWDTPLIQTDAMRFAASNGNLDPGDTDAALEAMRHRLSDHDGLPSETETTLSDEFDWWHYNGINRDMEGLEAVARIHLSDADVARVLKTRWGAVHTRQSLWYWTGAVQTTDGVKYLGHMDTTLPYQPDTMLVNLEEGFLWVRNTDREVLFVQLSSGGVNSRIACICMVLEIYEDSTARVQPVGDERLAQYHNLITDSNSLGIDPSQVLYGHLFDNQEWHPVKDIEPTRYYDAFADQTIQSFVQHGLKQYYKDTRK